MEFQPGVSPNHSASASYVVEARDYLNVVAYLQKIYPTVKKNNLIRIALLAGRDCLYSGETHSDEVDGVSCFFTGVGSGYGGFPEEVEAYVAGQCVSFHEIAEKIAKTLFGVAEGAVVDYIKECIFVGAHRAQIKMVDWEGNPYDMNNQDGWVDGVTVHFNNIDQVIDIFINNTEFEIDGGMKQAFQGALNLLTPQNPLPKGVW